VRGQIRLNLATVFGECGSVGIAGFTLDQAAAWGRHRACAPVRGLEFFPWRDRDEARLAQVRIDSFPAQRELPSSTNKLALLKLRLAFSLGLV